MLLLQVLYGLDYTASDQEKQHALVKEAIMEHIKFHPQSLIVIEEYDKLDCRTRGLLKQLIDSSQSTNVTINRYICSCKKAINLLRIASLRFAPFLPCNQYVFTLMRTPLHWTRNFQLQSQQYTAEPFWKVDSFDSLFEGQ